MDRKWAHLILLLLADPRLLDIVSLAVMSSCVLLAPNNVILEVNITLQDTAESCFVKCHRTLRPGRRAGGSTLDIWTSTCPGRPPDHQKLTALLRAGRWGVHSRGISCSRSRVTEHSFPSISHTSSLAAIVGKLWPFCQDLREVVSQVMISQVQMLVRGKV